MKIEFDPAKDRANFRKHGVRFEEAASCLLDPLALVREDGDASGEQRFVLLGMRHMARLLVVVYTLRGDAIRLISDRKPTKTEEKTMRDEYSFFDAKRVRDVPHLVRLQAEMAGKTRITIRVDNRTIEAFKARAANSCPTSCAKRSVRNCTRRKARLGRIDDCFERFPATAWDAS
jgi:uncharacterized DUF497 family protein